MSRTYRNWTRDGGHWSSKTKFLSWQLSIMPSRYLLHFAQAHNDFRLPELQSIAELYGIAYSLPPQEEDHDPTRPFMVIEVEKEEHVRILARRCILIKYVLEVNQKINPGLFLPPVRAVYEFYGQGSTYDDLHEANRKSKSLWTRYVEDTSFRFLVTSSQHKIPQSRQREVIESFAYMGFLGKIEMKNPDILLICFEECGYSFDEVQSGTCG
jgi:tRNA (guanine10-N2)-methyltransferase